MSSKELPTPSLDEIKTWDEHRIFEHFRHPALGLKPDHVAILRDQETDGDTLILLTENDLWRPPFNLRGGPVKKIMNEIVRLKGTGSQQESTQQSSTGELPTPSLDEIKTWDEHRVFEHFRHHALGLKPDHVAILRDQETDGGTLILLTENDLFRSPYSLRGGPGKKIINEIARLKGTGSQQKATQQSSTEAEIEPFSDLASLNEEIITNTRDMNGTGDMKNDTGDARDIFSSLDELYGKVDSLPKVMLDLHEDTVPRLFFIFPEDGYWWAPSIDSFFTKTFRLFFLCEHETIENGSTKKQFHLAYHDGYRVVRPREFVTKYGPYIRMIMPCLLLAVRLGGRLLECVPAFREAAAEVRRASGQVASTVYRATESSVFTDHELVFCAQTKKFFNQARKYMTNAPPSIQTQGRTRGLAERPDLRELQVYLEGWDNASRPGNLQRMLRREDNGSIAVRWVCKNHASEWETTNAIRSLHATIKSSSIDHSIKFDDDTWELTIQGLSNESLHTFRNSATSVLSSVPLRKISFTACIDAHTEDVEALINAAITTEIVVLKQTNNIQVNNILQKCFQLREFHLPDNHLGDTEVCALAEALKTNTSLQKLNLHDNCVGSQGAGALAEALKTNTSLQNLNLEYNDIGDQGASTLAEALKTNTSLQNLNLRSNGIVGRRASVLKVITSLNLQFNGIGSQGAKALAEALKMNTNLQTLNLESNAIGDQEASALAEALKTNTSLQDLNIRHNRIGDQGACALAEALKTNTSLQNLNLGANDSGNQGAGALAEVLKTNTKMQMLNLETNGIGNEGARALAEALKTNTSMQNLNLGGNDIDGQGATTLAAALKRNTNMQNLNLRDNSIGNQGASALAAALKTNTSMQNINLQSNRILGQGASALAEALKTNTNLQNLNLEYNGIGDEGANALAEALKTNTSMQSLNLKSTRIVGWGATALAEALKTNTSLQNLNLQDNVVGNQGASSLAEALKTNMSLQDLNLHSSGIGVQGASVLAEALKTTTSLQNLNLRHNGSSYQGASALAEALKTNTSIQTLNLGENGIGDQGASALAEALKTNTTLQNLNLEYNGVGIQGTSELAEARKVNTSLTIVI